jgi:uncharacterized membrane protein YccC
LSPATVQPLSSAQRSWAAAIQWISGLRSWAPAVLFGFRLWASVCLALCVAFWLQLDNAYWAGTSAAIVCQPQLGASLRKGWFRMLGTLIGAIAIVVMTACFPQDRTAFLVTLAVWGGACALVATLLRNFASYAAALAGYTAAIIASDQLGAVGGLNGQAFLLAVARGTEICLGIICAGIVLAGTDMGGARRRLAGLFANLGTDIARNFAHTLAVAGAEFDEAQKLRRELIRRVIALESEIDQSLGESSQLRYYSPVLQNAVAGLFAALAAWRAVAVLLERLPHNRASREADAVFEQLTAELRMAPEQADAACWIGDPDEARTSCDGVYESLRGLSAKTPSSLLLADQSAAVFAGLSRALNALVLLVSRSTRSARTASGVRHLRIPDWLPSLVNGGRAFVTISAVALFWIITQWSSGALAITFAAIGVILFAPRADQAYAIVMSFMVGTTLTALFAAIIEFAVLPRLETFPAFCLAIGLVLVPAGAGMAQPWQTAAFTAMAANFIPLLAPANQMSYDTLTFYNSSLAIVAGVGAAAISFRVLPPLSPAYRARRLLLAVLRDLCRLILRPTARTVDDWAGRGYGRLSALPDEATPLQRAQLSAGLQVGAQIIRLRRDMRGNPLSGELDAGLAALVREGVAPAVERLARLDQALAAEESDMSLRPRAGLLAISEALTQHAPYFAMGAAA